jgi:kynurenine 3-monooxygenase
LLDELLAAHADPRVAFTAYEAARRPNTAAIAAMALENYQEMREGVRAPQFPPRRALELRLEQLFPNRFIPRYSMVMFHHEIPYRTALDRGKIQSRLLADLTAAADTLQDVDYDRAEREINRELSPISLDHDPA